MKHTIAILLVSVAFFAPTSNAQAQDRFSVGIGYYDILDDEDALDLRLEYRPDHEYFWNIKPWAGAEITSDTSLWAGGGLLADIDLTEKWVLTPSIGAGLYAQGSSDLDLGYPIIFRSQLEAAYKLTTGNRLGIAFGHFSNAGLDNENPGTEVFNVYYHYAY